ncbi:MAG: hypothetical protein A2802_01315 [Candidatus Woykebacteria bacterium RIFCSPHIGHO2_01_FULL_43_29]|uniref:Uncharacterized protein n=1 Tax=Candidatus Woykebacteria bacterium RIFCSPHIGHO2_02_FULL_43_16b TaxID=1802601 RepID=A0A1G1WMY5_9BACT|nr:MAG: hypothetical protein A2802_01315 [Candidatus Woykebacteria bacterium RIFCSPHIGHO2_01_FULL_43_29]OGY29105.1 MAG: hypothetical protein A3J50_02360 [Candidatus Woykebacteria bacterium RIFCSPHIGHO2_02_FULL_43_16b]
MKISVIGLGSMGKNHARIYKELVGDSLVGVSDLNTSLGNQIGEQLGVNYYSDYHKMLVEEKPDVVSICTPTSTHFEIAKRCLEQNTHLLIEKPITNNVDKANELNEIATKKGLIINVGYVERFNPGVSAIRKCVQDKKIISINITRVGPFPPRVSDVGIIIDLGVHDIDLISYITGSSFERVFAVKSKEKTKRENAAVLSFKMVDGTIASVVTNWFTPFKVRKIEVALKDSLIVGDLITQEVSEFYGYENSEYTTRSIHVDKQEPLKLELGCFLESVKQQKNLGVSAKEAIQSLAIALDLTNSD